MGLPLLVMLLAAAPRPSPAFVEKFPTLAAPLVVTATSLKGVKLAPSEAIADLLEPAASKAGKPLPEGLRALWAPSMRARTQALLEGRAPGEPGETMEIHALGKLSLQDGIGLLVLVKQAEPMSVDETVYLLMLDGDGRYAGGAALASTGGDEMSGQNVSAKISGDGAIALTKLRGFVIHDLNDAPGELNIRSEQALKIGPHGKISQGDNHYLSWAGKFIDRKSQEELFLFDEGGQVVAIYRASAIQPSQRLEVGSGTKPRLLEVRFPASAKPSLLALDEGGERLNCRKPDGKTQRFEREW